MKKYSILFFLFCYIFFNTVSAQTLTMGYRLDERLPLIQEQPNNSGIYFDLYQAAAKKMNLTLKVVRLPKKRILRGIQEGTIDFYPGFTFTQPRTQFAYFLKNGLSGGGEMGLSLRDFPLIEDLHQLEGKRVLVALGGPIDDLLANIKGVKLNKVPRLSIQKAIALLRLKRHDFYIYNTSSVKYYLQINNITDIKLHPDCCGGDKPMYLGFSRTSKHFQEIPNPYYDHQKPISIDNLPTVISKDSLAYKFAMTLKQMKKSGETQKIVEKYIK